MSEWSPLPLISQPVTVETPVDPYALHSGNRTAIRRITLKRDSTFLITDVGGDMPTSQQEAGLFWHDTRFIRQLDLVLADQPLMPLSHSVADEGDACQIDLCNPFLRLDGEDIPQGTIHVQRWISLHDQHMTQHLTISAYHHRPLHFRLGLTMQADFADLFAIRGMSRHLYGEYLAPQLDRSAVTMSYRGRDNVLRTARIGFSQPVDDLNPRAVYWDIEAKPGELVHIRIEVEAQDSTTDSPLTLHPSMDDTPRLMAEVQTDHILFNRLLSRGADDLIMLSAATPDGPYPYAGVPWYVCPFGRDGLITSLEFLPWFPEIARGTLKFLARHQGKQEDAFTEEQPGRIMHELRHGEMANAREIPFIPYYGTIDATPLFLITLAAYLRWTADNTLLQQLWPNAKAAAEWMITFGDRDGDGFLEYIRNTEKGLFNQGWKDSYDSVSHENGELADAPIALCEVQGYAFAAYRAMAFLATQMGESAEAASWEKRALALQQKFVEHFWWEAEQCFVLALDSQKRPCRVVSSNAGQCLWTGIVPDELAGSLVARLLRDDMDAGWGVRTLSSRAARYNPMSYHNGSVWPHDTALIGAGFARYGYHREAGQLLEGLLALSLHYERARLPELCCGFARRQGFGPTHYPVACSPQAWAAGAPHLLLGALLGLDPEAERGVLTLRRPTLPSFLQAVQISRLKLGTRSVDLRFTQASNGAAITLLDGEEIDLHVLTR